MPHRATSFSADPNSTILGQVRKKREPKGLGNLLRVLAALTVVVKAWDPSGSLCLPCVP